jgi:Glucodextranase, domain B
MVGRFVLVVAVLALAVGVLYLGAGGLTTVAGAVGSTLTGFVANVTATPIPSPTIVPATKAPTIASPNEPYTNQGSVDLVVTVPTSVVGDPAYRLKVYLALEGQVAAPIQETPLAPGPQTIVPVVLTSGINDFTVSLVGPGGESEVSPVVRFVLDTKKPSIKLTAPRDGAIINRKTVDIEGRSQGRSTLIARNRTTGDSIVGNADGDGHFALRLPIAMGENNVTLTATDPAGNVGETKFHVTRGSGELRASLGASTYSIKRSALPEPIRLTVTVDDPDGKPLKGARVTFTLSIPGIKTVTGDAKTDANGRASFQTTIPKGADPGGGMATALVRTNRFGSTSARTVITIRK